MMNTPSKVTYYRPPGTYDGLRFGVNTKTNESLMNEADVYALRDIGIDVTKFFNPKTFEVYQGAMDSLQATQSVGSIATPIQFLQTFLPGAVLYQTKAKKADEAAGLTIVGKFEDAEVVQRTMEYTGQPIAYSDFANTPLSSWNSTYERRSVVRFEEGVQIGDLESATAARAQIDDGGEKRKAAAEALNRLRNTIAFYGYNNGLGRTYGLLNDPNLPVYLTASAKTLGGTTWANGNFLEITNDIRFLMSTLRQQSGDNIEPKSTALNMVISSVAIEYLSVVTDFGITVQDWLDKNYPLVSLVSTPDFDAANGGENVVYLFPTSVSDGSTDDGKVLDQLVQTTFRFNGSQVKTKTVEESYSMATAGIMVKRPIDVVRMTGI